MKLEDQVCPPEHGERLKVLGIIQESLFYWTHSDWGTMPAMSIDFKNGNPTSQFTPTELGVLLPDQLCTKLHQYELILIKEGNDTWVCEYCRANNLCDTHPDFDTKTHVTQAAVMAEMLVQLIELKIVTAEECNKRLTQS